MPTGYTAGVQDGTVTEFADFALGCARAFAALIMMRDDPADTPIPEKFEPSNWNAEKLAAAKAELAELKNLSARDTMVFADRDYADAVARWQEREAKYAVERDRYLAMLAKAEAYVPPTPDHVELKQFMVRQLKESIDWDCKSDAKPARQSPAEWHAAAIKSAEWSVAYHTKEDAAERERAASRTAWVQALRESLADPVPRVVR